MQAAAVRERPLIGVHVEPRARVTVRIDRELRDLLAAKAKASERSFSGELRVAVRRHLQLEPAA